MPVRHGWAIADGVMDPSIPWVVLYPMAEDQGYFVRTHLFAKKLLRKVCVCVDVECVLIYNVRVQGPKCARV